MNEFEKNVIDTARRVAVNVRAYGAPIAERDGLALRQIVEAVDELEAEEKRLVDRGAV